MAFAVVSMLLLGLFWNLDWMRPGALKVLQAEYSHSTLVDDGKALPGDPLAPKEETREPPSEPEHVSIPILELARIQSRPVHPEVPRPRPAPPAITLPKRPRARNRRPMGALVIVATSRNDTSS